MLPLHHAPSPQTPARLHWLDVMRGFALCGILLANVRPIANAGELVIAGDPAPVSFGQLWPGLFVDQRFYPIFSLLFGIGFALLFGSAQTRTARPRLVLLRRLLVLLALGLVHMFLLWRGDVLTIYAVAGLVALLPSTWLPRWAVAALGAAVVVASLALSGGAFTLVPGLFLVGAALVRYGLVEAAERSPRAAVAGVTGAAAFAVAAVPLLVWQVSLDPADPAFSRAFALAGLAVAGVYVCAVVALMNTGARRVLEAVFAPLGRMALTNYLSATLIVLAVRPLVGGTADQWGQGTVVVIAGAVLAAQWAWSRWWLGRYRQGPLEWLWRWATWGHRPTFRRTAPATTR
ncbi:DUF418 domain-containing protein [Nonomuraea soli]|uniref:Putative membrane protein YeiB n=1 Tax=Nonomuraea soli TaxID=1032476 RepID=A0A7W0CSB1_9ACTN|nr:DUF418 domain-containing protein [Nonomuraea soli]MBA2896402.1 putative membrane protein YeiB [Nonomuraea soli]